MANENSLTPEQEAAIRNEELASAERAMTHMMSSDFGLNIGGEFQETAKGLDPVRTWTPDDRQLAAAISEEILVSGNPDIATPLSTLTPVSPNQDVSPPIPEPDAGIAGSDDQVFLDEIQQNVGIEDSPADFGIDVGQPGVPPPDLSFADPSLDVPLPQLNEELVIPEPPAPEPLAPDISDDADVRSLQQQLPELPAGRVLGMGRAASSEQEKQVVKQIVQQVEKGPDEALLGEKSREGQQARLAAARKERMDRVQSSAPRAPGSPRMGRSSVGPPATGDFGEQGTSFFPEPMSATEMGLVTAGQQAAESMSVAAVAGAELLRRIARILLQHTEQINALMDHLDVEDGEDYF